MTLVEPADGKGPAVMQCPSCDRPDPLKSAVVEGWIKGPLRPPV